MKNAGHNEPLEIPTLVVVLVLSLVCGASCSLKPKIRRCMTIIFVTILGWFSGGAIVEIVRGGQSFCYSCKRSRARCRRQATALLDENDMRSSTSFDPRTPAADDHTKQTTPTPRSLVRFPCTVYVPLLISTITVTVYRTKT